MAQAQRVMKVERIKRLRGRLVYKPNLRCITGGNDGYFLERLSIEDVGFEEFILKEIKRY